MEWTISFEDIVVHADNEEEAREEALNQPMLIESVEKR